MSTTPATFDNFQLEATDYRLLLTQSELQGARGVPDPLAPIVRRLDMNTDGDGFDPEQRFSEKMADGLDAPLSIGLVGDEGTFGGNLTARYRELRHDMPDLCGIDNLVSKTTLPDGRIKEVWRFPEGPRNIRTQTAWFGIRSKCWLLQYGKLQTWVLESERTGETGGNKSYHFNSAVRNQQFPAFVAQNSKWTIVATNVTGNMVVSYTLPGSSTSQSVTLVPGDTALQTKGKFEANGDGLIVNVVGTITSGATSKVNKSVAGSGAASGITNAVNLFDSDDATTVTYPVGASTIPISSAIWTFTTPTIVNAIRSRDAFGNMNIYGSLTGDFTDAVNLKSYAGNNSLAADTIGNFTNTTAYKAYAVQSVEGYPLTLRGVELLGDNTSGASGTLTVEVTTPGNARVRMSKTSGASGYTLTETQLGGDGQGAVEIAGPEIQPNHWLVYKGATRAELDAIDMGSATTPRDTTTPKLVKTAHGQTISFENLAQAVYLEDGKVNPGSHVTRRPTVTSSLTVDVQQMGTQDYAEDIYATENFGGCGVNPFWLRYAARCLQDEIWIDGRWARNQTAAHPVSEGLAQWQFPLTRIHDKSGSLFITFIYPAS